MEGLGPPGFAPEPALSRLVFKRDEALFWTTTISVFSFRGDRKLSFFSSSLDSSLLELDEKELF